MRMFTQLDSLKASISNLLENCGYGDSFIAKETGMTEAEFSSKKTNGKWSKKALLKRIEFFTIANGSFENKGKR
jgi:hypothetical protein